MFYKFLLFGLGLLQASPIQAVVVSAGLPSGLYSIPFDVNGTALSEPVLIRPAFDPPVIPSRVRRQQSPPTLPSSQSKCSSGNINVNDYNVAKANLQSECDHGDFYSGRTAIIFTTGSAVAYFCNYQNSNRCWREEYQTAMDRLVQNCGLGKGGEVYVSAYTKGYGGDITGQPICRF